MQRITRRRLLQLSGIGALTAASGGLAAILASGRAPAFAQGTTLHWVRGSDYVPVSDQTAQNEDPRAVPEGPRHQDQSRRRRRADDPGAGHFRRLSPAAVPTSSARSTIGRSSMPRASPMSATSPRKSARRRAAITKPRRRSPMTARSGSPCRIRCRAADRQPQLVVERDRLWAGEISGKPGRNGVRPAKS